MVIDYSKSKKWINGYWLQQVRETDGGMFVLSIKTSTQSLKHPVLISMLFWTNNPSYISQALAAIMDKLTATMPSPSGYLKPIYTHNQTAHERQSTKWDRAAKIGK